jgi:hypothetical protein
VIYRVLADAVVFFHFLWIVFLLFGVIIGRRNRSVKYLHISGLIFALTIQVFNWYCPLTHLEVWLRAKHDPAFAYPGSFIIHYMEELVYVELSRPLIFVLTILLCGVNARLYLKRPKSGN